MKIFEVDEELLSSFLCEEEMQYFIEWDYSWMKELGGYGYDDMTNTIVTFYITKNGHINVNIPYEEYLAKYNAKTRNKKLIELGI